MEVVRGITACLMCFSLQRLGLPAMRMAYKREQRKPHLSLDSAETQGDIAWCRSLGLRHAISRSFQL